MNNAITILLTMFLGHALAQNNRQYILNDSSELEISRTGTYIITEEKYRSKDSVLFTYRFIGDTTKIYKQGWKNKKGDFWGKWNEFNVYGKWLNTKDYDNNDWIYEPSLYPFQKYIDNAKKIAEQEIIEKYGEPFFKTNVLFKFDAYTIGKDNLITFWGEPIKEKPVTYHFDYTIELKDKNFYYNKLTISIDSLGNILKNNNERQINFEERVKGENDTFLLTYKKAIEICKENGMFLNDSFRVETDLHFDFVRDSEFSGRFLFVVRQFYDTKVIEGTCYSKCKTETTYKEWTIDPWSAVLLQNKKYRRVDHWTGGCGGGKSYEIYD